MSKIKEIRAKLRQLLERLNRDELYSIAVNLCDIENYLYRKISLHLDIKEHTFSQIVSFFDIKEHLNKGELIKIILRAAFKGSETTKFLTTNDKLIAIQLRGDKTKYSVFLERKLAVVEIAENKQQKMIQTDGYSLRRIKQANGKIFLRTYYDALTLLTGDNARFTTPNGILIIKTSELVFFLSPADYQDTDEILDENSKVITCQK